MNNCKYCGTQLPDGTDFCTTCGAMVKPTHATGPKPQQPSSATVKSPIHGGYLAWSIINIIFSTSFFFFGGPIVSLVLSIIALVKTAQAKLRTAKIMNIIATIITIVSIILCIAAVFVLFFVGGRLYDISPYYFYEFMD